MQYKIFNIPIFDNDIQTEELNKFLRSNKIIKVDKELVENGEMAYWTFCVQYLLPPPSAPIGEKKERTDYKNVLDKEQFKLFSILRKCRKLIANEDAVPAFAVFLDSELAEMTKLEQISEKNISSINGIGKQRTEKYASRLLEKINEEGRKSDTIDS